MAGNNFDELLSAAKAEVAAVESRRLEILAEIGAKALPEVRTKSDFAEPVSRLVDAERRAEELRGRMEQLREEKRLYERAEKTRLAKYTCVVCKKLNDSNARFCEECGKPVGELPREFCKACCTMNQIGLKFCGECGTKLESAALQ